MFTETREMLDATIYANGRSELGAKNVNLAMHGILDAAEGKFTEVDEEMKQNDVKITEIKQDIVKLGESGLGGLCFKLPTALFELMEVESVEDAYIDHEVIAIISAEYPALMQPLQELMEHNMNVLAKIREAITEGKEMPIVTIDIGALYKEILEALGETEPLETFSGASLYPSLAYDITYMGVFDMFNAMCNVYTDSTLIIAFTNDACGLADAIYPASVYIPRTDETMDNSGEALDILKSNYLYSGALLKNDYFYKYLQNGSYVQQAVAPVHARLSDIGNILFLRFVIGAQIIEAAINLETGVTTSRVIATMTPQEVETIAEGKITSEYSGVSYSSISVMLSVKSNVDWQVVKGEEVINSGAPSVNSYVNFYVTIPANDTTEIVNHNYRLLDATTGEELSTVWIKQQAGLGTVNEE